MARNKIQFQRGLSETGFAQLYGSEVQCRGALEQWRWPNGFICPECGATKSSFLAPRRLYQCAGCGRQTSVTAGTIFHRTKLPLTTWFRAMYLMTQSKNGVSAMELMRRLDVNYDTAWKLKHKLAQVMLEREATRRLDERVEVDDAYLGGERPGKPGRGAEGKTPFIAAVQTDWEGRPQRMVLHTVCGFTSEQVCRFAEQRLAPTADVYSDGLGCFAAVVGHGCAHTTTVSGGGRAAATNPTFKWVNTMLGNVKSALVGTYRHLDGRHAPRYLAEFQYRFNRRYDLAGMLARLAYAAVRTPPMPGHLLKLTEARG